MHSFVYFVVLLLAYCNAQIQPGAEKNSVCTVRNTYIPVDGNCDEYIECKDYIPVKMLCPEGLHFDLKAQWPVYPCGYPQDVSCLGRRITQPAYPSKDCPHQYGYFPSPLAKSDDCGHYRMCVEGQAFEMYCALGLAFNPQESRCDWPENVPTCNIIDFLGVTCPPGAKYDDGSPVVTNHQYGAECYTFYSCMNGKARLLSCDPGFAFDARVGRCVDADQVVCVSPVDEMRSPVK